MANASNPFLKAFEGGDPGALPSPSGGGGGANNGGKKRDISQGLHIDP